METGLHHRGIGALLDQAFQTFGAGATATHRSEVADLGVERSHDRGHVELVIVGEHAHRIARAESIADALEETMGPVDHDLIGVGEPSHGGEHLARVADGDVVAEHLGHAHERAGEVDRTEHEHAGRRRERLDEHAQVLGAGFAVHAVVTHAGAAASELAQRVAGDHAIEIGITEGAGRSPSLDHDGRPGTGALDHGGQGDGALVEHGGAPLREHRIGGIERFEEQMDGAAAGESDGEGLIIAVAEGHETSIAGGQHVEGLGHDGALDAAARDRPRHLAVVGDGHGRAGKTGTGPLDVDDARDGEAPSGGVPPIEVVDEFLHPALRTGEE